MRVMDGTGDLAMEWEEDLETERTRGVSRVGFGVEVDVDVTVADILQYQTLFNLGRY
jgi:hypothetical protein